MKIIDIGVNLMHRSFNTDRDSVIEDARFEGVSPLIITGTSERSSIEAARYATKYPDKLYSTAGVHPHDTKSCNNKTIEILKKLAQQNSVVAIGECGLDYNRDFSPRDTQRKWFEEQINLAIELNMPLFLHERDAFNDFVEILERKRSEISDAVVHCFTGTEE
jgi:TatD DNase family protein